MDLNAGELRRQLRDIDRMNNDAMPKWREALRHIVGDGAAMSGDEKAAALGVPAVGRRQLFRLGGATVLGAAVLAACGDDSDTDTAATTTTGGAGMGDGGDLDLTLARTAASLEQLAIDVYGNPDAGALLRTKAVIDAATLFASHHTAHRDALNGVITGAGGKEVTTANAAVFKALVEPRLPMLKSEAEVVMLAYDLESAAAQTYVFAGGTLSTPELRSTIMTIGGVEARHAAVLKMAALAAEPAEVFPSDPPRAFFPKENPLEAIDGALLSAS